MIKQIYRKSVAVLSAVVLLSACSKSFLEVKPQKNQVIVETLQDVGALLDNASVMSRSGYFRLFSDGDFHYTDAKVLSIPEVQRNLYLWNVITDPTGRTNSDWDLPYQQVMYANIAMETLDEMNDYGGDRGEWDELYGRALFFRAWAHYQLLQDFSEGYDPTKDGQLGVPVITDSSFPKQVKRETLFDVYHFIVAELIKALPLLPQQALIKTHPSAQAVYALLARIYLNMQQFDQALQFAEKALEINNTLLDFNTLSPTGALPFSQYNFSTHPEIIFFTSSNSTFVGVAGIQGEEGLYGSYLDDDLRKHTFFDADHLYIGNYSGTMSHLFTGMAADELYLIKAESLIRMGQLAEGRAAMEALLRNRFVDHVITADIPGDGDGLLHWVLAERRKELVGRGIRWTDLKRLNLDPETQVNLYRTYDGQQYELPANSSRYVFAIPQEEILTSGIEQNQRNEK